jgi:hypothetical protein
MAISVPDTLELGGEHFRAGRLVILWAYAGPSGVQRLAIMDTPRGEDLEILQRILRKLPGGRGHYHAFRRDVLRLAEPGDPLLADIPHLTSRHLIGFARAHEPVEQPTGAEPVVISLGNLRAVFAFQDIAYARAWAARVEATLGRRPPWHAFYAERWPDDAMRFRPRLQPAGRAHGFTDLEDELDRVLEADEARGLKDL